MASNALSLVSGLAQSKSLSDNSVCPICDLPALTRRDIEEAMACGVSDRVLKHMLREKLDYEIPSAVIAQHIEHLPARYYTYHQIISEKAKEAGVSIDDPDQDKLTPLAYLNNVLHDAQRTLVANPGTTNQIVGINVAKTLLDIQQNQESQQDAMQWVLKFKQLVNAIKLVCNQDQIAKILEMVDKQNE